MSFYSDAELRALGLGGFGQRVMVSKKCSIYGAERIVIGNDVRIDDFCVLSAGEGGVKIGSFVHIAIFSSLIGRGSIEVADFANISSRVSIYSSNDDYSGEHMTNPTIPEEYKGVVHRPVKIGRHAIIGSGSIVLPGVCIQDGAAIGALSLINSDCEAFGVYAGIPAIRKSERKRDLLTLERQFLASQAGSGK